MHLFGDFIDGMIYWYRWGKYTFDIRDARKKFGGKENHHNDLNFSLHECTRFTRIINDLIKLVGNAPFFEVMTGKCYTPPIGLS